ncbi:hypothetical protein D9M71_504040 [compost metagenome]
MHLLEGIEIGRVEDVALGVFHHYPYAVAQAAQGLAVFQEVLDVGVSLRNHLLEAGSQLEARDGHVAQQQRDQQDADHERQTVVEHHTFQQVSAARIEVLEILDYRHHAFFHATHLGSPLSYSCLPGARGR